MNRKPRKTEPPLNEKRQRVTSFHFARRLTQISVEVHSRYAQRDVTPSLSKDSPAIANGLMHLVASFLDRPGPRAILVLQMRRAGHANASLASFLSSSFFQPRASHLASDRQFVPCFSSSLASLDDDASCHLRRKVQVRTDYQVIISFRKNVLEDVTRFLPVVYI